MSDNDVQTIPCPQCGFESWATMKFCGMCGARLPNRCPRCGFDNPPDYRFCGQCGAPLEAEAPVVEAPPKTEPASDVSPPASSSASAAERLVGERRVATIVLADVQGSTQLLESVGTEAWVEMMNHVFQILESEIYRFGGKVDQFRGDGLVAFFGARAAHEDDPERAVMAALAMQTALEDYAAELAATQSVDLRLRIGVNTGEVIVTSVGDRRRYSEDTAMGEAIALAARMETAAEPGTVLVSEHTYRLIPSQFEWESLGAIRVKGVSEPVHVYRPLVPQPDIEELHRLRSYGLSIPLVGREAEFEALKSQVEHLRGGRGGVALVTGDKGIGKSFIVTEVRHYFARQGALLAEARQAPETEVNHAHAISSLRWLNGRCRSYDQSWPYAMWQDLVQHWLGVCPEESKEATSERLQQKAQALWGASWSEFYPYLADFLSLPVGPPHLEQIKHLDAEGKRRQLFHAIRSWLEAMMNGEEEPRPLVIVFSEVHWSDATSLDLLKYCLSLSDHKPLLWMLVFYPDRGTPVWNFRHYLETEYPHRLTNLSIPPLTPEQSGEFIDRLIGADTLPPATRELVIDKAEGNPYYIQELIHAMIMEGALERDVQSGAWRMTHAVTSLDLPDSLQSLLLARIDRLDVPERQVLQRASVIGAVFWLDVLRVLLDHGEVDAAALRSHLTALQRTQFIQERGQAAPLGMEYAFNSTLIREAAYESLLRARRVAYHRQIAAYFEDRFGDEVPTKYNCLLAHHYHQAGDVHNELRYTLRAAEHAQEIYANIEAVRRYTDALALLRRLREAAPDAEQRRQWQVQIFEVLGHRRAVYELLGRRDEMRDDAQALLTLARQLEERPLLIDALLQQPAVRLSFEDPRTAIPMAKKALTLARQLEDRHREMQALLALSDQQLYLNDPAWQTTGEEALALARELGDRQHEAQILIQLGKFCSWTDKPEQGMTYFREAMEVTHALDDKLTEVALLDQLGLDAEREGDYYRLLTEYHQKRLRLSREIAYRDGEISSLTMCGQTQSVYLGDYAGGLALLHEAEEMADSETALMFSLLRLVQIYAILGDYQRAEAALTRLRQIDERLVFATARAGQRLVAAILYNEQGGAEHWHHVLSLADEVIAMEANNPLLSQQYEIVVAHERTRAHLGLAQQAEDTATREEHLRAALAASQAALDLFEQVGYLQVVECVSEAVFFTHSRALRANGENAQAERYLRRAYDEMMRKHDLIPEGSDFRRTYLENIPLHQTIHRAYDDEDEEISAMNERA